MGAFINSAAIALSLTIVSSAVYAQDAVQNSETAFFVQTSGGVPQVCGLEFTLAYSDYSYRQGALAGVTGSLAWMESKGGVNVFLKIIGSDFINTTNGIMTPKPFSVFQGFAVVDGNPILPSILVPCEQSTGFCAGYSLQNSVAIFGALASQKSLAIGFSRQAKGGLDITLPLDTRPSSTANPNDFIAYNNCMGTLLNRAESNLRTKN